MFYVITMMAVGSRRRGMGDGSAEWKRVSFFYLVP